MGLTGRRVKHDQEGQHRLLGRFVQFDGNIAGLWAEMLLGAHDLGGKSDLFRRERI